MICDLFKCQTLMQNFQNLLQSDLMVCCLLTIVTFGLVSMSLVGLQYFTMQGNRMGFAKVWTQGSLIVFLIIIVSIFLNTHI